VRDPDGLGRALAGITELIIDHGARHRSRLPESPVEQPVKGNTFLGVGIRGTERSIAAGRGPSSVGQVKEYPSPALDKGTQLDRAGRAGQPVPPQRGSAQA
jgi:hypothetical protein